MDTLLSSLLDTEKKLEVRASEITDKLVSTTDTLTGLVQTAIVEPTPKGTLDNEKQQQKSTVTTTVTSDETKLAIDIENVSVPTQDTNINKPKEVNHAPANTPVQTDLWVIGSSIVRQLRPSQLYNYSVKQVKITTLPNKSIAGAQEEIGKQTCVADNILLQIGSNDVERRGSDIALEEMEGLINTIKTTFPKSSLAISEVLPRFYRDLDKRDKFEEDRKKYNKEIRTLCAKKNVTIVSQQGFKEHHMYDGVHPHISSGMPVLIGNYKVVLDKMLGITYKTPLRNNQTGARYGYNGTHYNNNNHSTSQSMRHNNSGYRSHADDDKYQQGINQHVKSQTGHYDRFKDTQDRLLNRDYNHRNRDRERFLEGMWDYLNHR
jgi:hypothetical protein